MTTPKNLTRALKASAAFAIATGSLDVILGVRMLGIPTDLTSTAPQTALIDSQFRFLGTIWAGYGVWLWWASNDIHARRIPLALLGGTMFMGGVGRLLSALEHGFPARWVQIATLAELFGPPLFWYMGSWGARVS